MINKKISYKLDAFQVIANLDKIFVIVDDSFTNLLKNKIMFVYGSLDNFNREFIKIDAQTFKWPFKTNNGHNLKRLQKICEFLDINQENVFKEIKGFYSWGSHNKPVKINQYLEITEQFVEGYGLYVAEGDTGDSGKTKPRKLRFTNSEPSVINFYINWIKTVFPKVTFYVVAIIPRKTKYFDNTKEINYDLRLQKGDYNKQVKYRVCMDNSIIIDLILGIRTMLKELILKDKNLMCAYLRGLMAGEGTVYNNRNKYVRLEMKNPEEINYVKNLLELLDIKFTFHRRSNRKNMEIIYVGGKKNIMRYYQLVGFGSHKQRQLKLSELVESY